MLHRKKICNWSACSKKNNFGFSYWRAAGLCGKGRLLSAHMPSPQQALRARTSDVEVSPCLYISQFVNPILLNTKANEKVLK
jgi:hypothetical protein